MSKPRRYFRFGKSVAKKSAGRSMIEVLQEELAEKRRLVRECEDELTRRRADVDEYVGKVADALGLPNPAKREAKRLQTLELRRQVKKLHGESVPIAIIAKKLGVERDLVARIVAKLGDGDGDNNGDGDGGEKSDPPVSEPSIPPGMKAKDWKLERTRVLYLEGKTVGEIADALGKTEATVYTYLKALREQKRIGSRADEGASDDAPRGGKSDDEDDGDDLEDLRAEVVRQQGGMRGKAARLETTIACDPEASEGDSHDHVVVVDRMGDGQTQPDASGHAHKVYRFVMGRTAKHRHGLLAKEPTPG